MQGTKRLHHPQCNFVFNLPNPLLQLSSCQRLCAMCSAALKAAECWFLLFLTFPLNLSVDIIEVARVRRGCCGTATFSEKRFICAVRLPCQTTPDASSGLFGAPVSMSGCLCPLLAESVRRVLFALLCQRVRPDPFGRT